MASLTNSVAGQLSVVVTAVSGVGDERADCLVETALKVKNRMPVTVASYGRCLGLIISVTCGAIRRAKGSIFLAAVASRTGPLKRHCFILVNSQRRISTNGAVLVSGRRQHQLHLSSCIRGADRGQRVAVVVGVRVPSGPVQRRF